LKTQIQSFYRSAAGFRPNDQNLPRLSRVGQTSTQSSRTGVKAPQASRLPVMMLAVRGIFSKRIKRFFSHPIRLEALIRAYSSHPARLMVWLSLLWPTVAAGQSNDTLWSLQQCIDQALNQNLQVRKAIVSNDINKIGITRSKSARLPSLSAGVSQSFSWNGQQVEVTSGNMLGVTGTNVSVNSSVPVFKGFQLTRQIRQSEIGYEAGRYDELTTRETISLNVLNAYLLLLFSIEQEKNSERQVELTTEQLGLARQREQIGAISHADLLQVASQLAVEKQTLATVRSGKAINRIALMQLLEIPAGQPFGIQSPDTTGLIRSVPAESADSIYTIAIGIKPQIKGARLKSESAELDIDIAKSGYYPQLSVNAGLSFAYSNQEEQPIVFENRLNPMLGLTLTIPIYQNSQVRSGVGIARLNADLSRIDELNTKNLLRKEIEQASQDLTSSVTEYEAGVEQYLAAREAYHVAAEKFDKGLYSPVEFLVQKTNLVTSENNLLQAKYKLLFSRKMVEFYKGRQLTL
jgi:outer membrane protein